MSCPAISDQSFLSSVLAHVDCQAQMLGDGGYHALAQPGSEMVTLVGLALTIFVALIGYRLILGDRFDVREIVTPILKIGAVLLLATSWPAFKTVVYDVAMHEPARLAETLGGATALPGLSGDLVDRLQLLDWQFDELDQRGSGVVSAVTAGEAPGGVTRRVDALRDWSRLGLARLLYLSAIIASFAVVQFSLGLLLALAPLFAIFLLFEGTRGLFIGWLRGLIAASLGTLAIHVVLAIELAMLEPWMSAVVGYRRAEIATPSLPAELLVITFVFALTLAGLLVLSLVVARGLKWPPPRALPFDPMRIGTRGQVALASTVGGAGGVRVEQLAGDPPGAAPTRAAAIADSITRRIEIEGGQRWMAQGQTAGRPGAADGTTSNFTPLGRSFQRRTQGRTSNSMARRDKA